MGWRTIHYCDLCGVEDTSLIKLNNSSEKCDQIELCPSCIKRVENKCDQEQIIDVCNDIRKYGIWDLNLFMFCPNCKNYINAFTSELYDYYNRHEILIKEKLMITCHVCNEVFEINTMINLPSKRL